MKNSEFNKLKIMIEKVTSQILAYYHRMINWDNNAISNENAALYQKLRTFCDDDLVSLDHQIQHGFIPDAADIQQLTQYYQHLEIMFGHPQRINYDELTNDVQHIQSLFNSLYLQRPQTKTQKLKTFQGKVNQKALNITKKHRESLINATVQEFLLLPEKRNLKVIKKFYEKILGDNDVKNLYQNYVYTNVCALLEKFNVRDVKTTIIYAILGKEIQKNFYQKFQQQDATQKHNLWQQLNQDKQNVGDYLQQNAINPDLEVGSTASRKLFKDDHLPDNAQVNDVLKFYLSNMNLQVLATYQTINGLMQDLSRNYAREQGQN